ncbi:polysaccharide deacetylase family protein [Pectinatus frisingensis]|jgi:peptidoglycan/xylan/chitin deacetylase (PgdA/CDA1 family)|uniref:polysaccharide deacetylase family protein n=1 Tax=Pectinatus frisingensis TaxID=865 RepID=UPI0018C81887|nr:polysaccharide deacetylase family protein [Pectinatus frisingensis]
MRYSLIKKIVLIIFLCFIPVILTSPHVVSQNSTALENTGQDGIIVLNYHKIDDVNISLSVRPADFDKQMAYLKNNDYNVITPDDLYENLEQGKELPPNPVLITFDDGYEDNYKNAYPILKKYGFTATVFVITSFLNKYPNYLTWDQCRELKENGFYIESHTVTHRSLTELTNEQIKDEIVQSKAALDKNLGQNTYYFAYPTGTYNLYIAQMLKDAGYRAAFTIKYGTAETSSNIFALERIPIFHTADTFSSFYRRLNYIPLFEKLGWIKS